jgi:adenosylcobinamide-GDP ribazoletransferase
MKTAINSLITAFQMFSVIPMPNIEYNDKNMRYMLSWLPLIGAVIGAAMGLWLALAKWLGLGASARAAGLAVIPVIISGGIHMDGFCDATDALSSHGLPEKKRQILKDSNAGAFAVIAMTTYMVIYVAACTELADGMITAVYLGLQQMLSRCLGGYASLRFPSSSQHGMQYTFQKAADVRAIVPVYIWMAISAGAMIVIAPLCGVLCTLAGFLCLLYLKNMARREFEGMSGDLAGWLITVSQLAMLIVYALCGKLA